MSMKTLMVGDKEILVKWQNNVAINGMVVAVKYGNYKDGFYFFDPREPLEKLDGIDFEQYLEIRVFGQNESKIVLSGISEVSLDQNNNKIDLELTNHTQPWSRSAACYPTTHFKEFQQIDNITRQPFITFKEVTKTLNSDENIRRRLYAQILCTKSTIGESPRVAEYIKLTPTYGDIPCVDLPSRESVTYKILQLKQEGNFYRITESCYDSRFITHNTISDVMELKKMAESHIQFSEKMTVSCLFRNKPSGHKTIKEARRTGIMKKYLKDNNGDQASSINKQIHGLFLSATNDRSTNKPPSWSPFGDYRIMIPPSLLFDIKSNIIEEDLTRSDLHQRNLFFADFYCKPPTRRKRGRNQTTPTRPHYVTLILTTPGSEEDRYCKNRLVQLDIRNNKFLYFDQLDSNYKTVAKDKFNVEVLYTEDIDLNFMRKQPGFQEVHGVDSKTQSSPEGIAKNKACSICNLPKTFE